MWSSGVKLQDACFFVHAPAGRERVATESFPHRPHEEAAAHHLSAVDDEVVDAVVVAGRRGGREGVGEGPAYSSFITLKSARSASLPRRSRPPGRSQGSWRRPGWRCTWIRRGEACSAVFDALQKESWRTSPSMSELSFEAEPSTARLTGTPRSSISRTRQIPEPRRMFDEGQCATPCRSWRGSRAPRR